MALAKKLGHEIILQQLVKSIFSFQGRDLWSKAFRWPAQNFEDPSHDKKFAKMASRTRTRFLIYGAGLATICWVVVIFIYLNRLDRVTKTPHSDSDAADLKRPIYKSRFSQQQLQENEESSKSRISYKQGKRRFIDHKQSLDYGNPKEDFEDMSQKNYKHNLGHDFYDKSNHELDQNANSEENVPNEKENQNNIDKLTSDREKLGGVVEVPPLNENAMSKQSSVSRSDAKLPEHFQPKQMQQPAKVLDFDRFLYFFLLVTHIIDI